MSGKSEMTKVVLASALGALVGAGVYGLAERAHAEQLAAAPVLNLVELKPLREPPAAAPTMAEAAPEANAERAAAAEPSPPADPQAAALERVRAQLRSGDATGARQALKRIRKPRDRELAQERELLAIETQLALGQLPAAKRAARAFAKAHPDSPQLANLEKMLPPQ